MRVYHDFSLLGLSGSKISGWRNFRAKSVILTSYIAYAVAHGGRSISDLFCADGYYGMLGMKLGCVECYGVDDNRDGWLGVGYKMRSLLNLEGMSFYCQEINKDSKFPRVDIVLNAGGLYHVDDPEGVLRMSYKLARKYLIVQSAVSMANEGDDYYEAPAPGWKWGNRYSVTSFDKMLKAIIPKESIVDSFFNELPDNARLEDRGSVYYLIKKEGFNGASKEVS